MKSYFLEGMDNEQRARSELSSLLPRQSDPWLIESRDGDAIAYLNIYSCDGGGIGVQADTSGRHYDEDERVLGVLKRLQSQLGGVVLDDDDDEKV